MDCELCKFSITGLNTTDKKFHNGSEADSSVYTFTMAESPTPWLLTSNEPPSPDERSLILETLRKTQNKIHALFQRIEERNTPDHPFSRIDRDTWTQLEVLEDFLRRHRAILSPLRSFPSELLAEIFILSIPVRPVDIDIFYDDRYYYSRKAYGFAQTCRYWRNIAQSTPQIWTKIPTVLVDYTLLKPNISPGPRLSLIKLFLERSKPAPIHVRITSSYYNRYDDNNNQFDRCPFEGNLSLVLSQSHRWKSADIQCVSVRRLTMHGKIQVPILEHLHIKTRYPYREVFAGLPSLTHFEGEGETDKCLFVPEVQARWSSLERFTGYRKMLGAFAGAADSLKQCEVQYPFYPRTRMGVNDNQPPIRFTRLTSLTVRGPIGNTEFRCIEAPLLQRLSIAGRNPRYEYAVETGPISNLLSKTLPGSSLRSLKFYMHRMDAQDLRRLLEATPLLEVLHLWDTPSSHFWPLAYDKNIFMPLVPRLQTLTIRQFKGHDLEPFNAVYHSRRAPPLECDARPNAVIESNIMINLTYKSWSETHGSCYLLLRRATPPIDILCLDSERSEVALVRAWCTYLVRQFLDPVQKAKKAGMSFARKKRERFARLHSNWARVDKLFVLLEGHPFPEFEPMGTLGWGVTRLANVMKLIYELPAEDVQEDAIYNFRLRAWRLHKRWSSLMTDVQAVPKWRLTDDYKTLRLGGFGVGLAV
ncbi:unnamed protein product [Cyclocybe aegerita]|uniref:F-box domain-containing protein n=1 Tax=Cyclocybe aegerita TaxID=1973307 RepID=A0A8S0VQM2_CYCAE|nr:unnamed protein product [Cyclocybe aegerita]